MKTINKYKPAKSWLKEYYKCDQSITFVDKTEYGYPENHLNFIGAELYLNKRSFGSACVAP